MMKPSFLSIPDSGPTCVLSNVSRRYQTDETIEPVLNLNFKVDPYDFISIEGASGIGKSTLLYLLGGLLKADQGEVFLFSHSLSHLTERSLTELRARHIGFVFQGHHLLPALTLFENLKLAGSLRSPKKEIHQEALALLEQLGLADRKNHLPSELSGGQIKRAMVAGALIGHPRLILADEPTNDLDPVWSSKVMELFQNQARQGASVVMVTHHLAWSSQASKRYEMKEGRLKLQ